VPIPVALVITSFDPGGTERQTAELISRLNSDRFTVHAVCLRREGLWLRRVEGSARSVTEFRLKGFRSVSAFTRLVELAAWCRRNRIAVLQACDLYANILALPAAALANVPVRIGSRRDILLPQRSAGQHRLQRHAYRFAHRIVTNSRAAAAQVRNEGIADTRITTIPNGIDAAAYPDRAAPVRSRVVTTVANLRPEKGHDTLIEAAALVAARCPDVRFQIVGEGEMRDALERQVKGRRLERHVRFLGHREDVAELLSATEVFVLPSRTEAFPNSLLEAMAMGVPSIATQVGGIPELVDNDQNGLLIPAGDAPALANAVVTLLTDGNRAARLGLAARATITSRYSFDRMVSAFEQLYINELRMRAPAQSNDTRNRDSADRGTSLAEEPPTLVRSTDPQLEHSGRRDEPMSVSAPVEKVS
jgi:L-malate glycosyltransferase